MRVLLLHRQPFGGIASLTRLLMSALAEFDVEAEVEEASSWIPNATDLASCRPATKRLKEIGADFDIVHAFGYRAAWACSDAYGSREIWFYTAYDTPKTTHRMLIEKLNEGEIGFCASHAVREELSTAGAMDLVVRYPGIDPNFSRMIGSSEARALFGLRAGAPLIAGLGRFVEERCFDILIDAMEVVWPILPDACLVLAGEGPDEEGLREMAKNSTHPQQISFLRILRNPADLIGCVDLIVVPSRNPGFSMVALEAMALGTPVLLRSAGGLPEIAERGHTGFFFNSDEDLGEQIAEALEMPLTMQSYAQAAKVKAESFFSIRACAEAISKAYRSVLE